MQLYIAEKPDIANAIAEYLWPEGGYRKAVGFYQKGSVAVSWAVVHLLELPTPDAYDKRYAQWKYYRIFPEVWKHAVISRSGQQFRIVADLLKKADVVIHAGNPDREGQLLIEEILHYCNYKGSVQRLLINAKDDVSMRRAFATIEDNRKYESLYAAGLAREEADWLVGINLTRCYTTNASRFSPGAVWNIGRVKVPTLALVVNREKEIRNFRVRTYCELKAFFTKDGTVFSANWQPDEKRVALDEEGRLLDKKTAQAVQEKVLGADGIVQKVTRKKGTEAPPLPYSLDTLQVEANARFGISPKQTLFTVQSLYEKKFVSYPRSDCNYIPRAQHKDAPRILRNLAGRSVRGADGADVSLYSRAWNDKKVTAHHAIIPTGDIPHQLTATEEKIYNMIAERYVMQFYPPCELETITFEILLEDELFKGSGKMIIRPGFRVVFTNHGKKEGEEKEAGIKTARGKKSGADKADETAEEENRTLPDLVKGENLGHPDKVDLLEKETKPPKRFTEGTLLEAMANIYRFMDPKNPNREKLKEVKGIGTPATRDTIISELQGKRGNQKTQMPFMEKVKKELVPTELGFQLIENVDVSLTRPDTTAEMEFALTEIARGEGSPEKFIQEVCATIDRNIEYAQQHRFPGYEAQACPVCKTGHLLKHYSPKTKRYFYVCDDKQCVSPVTGKTVYYAVDKAGNPVIEYCPHDKAILEKKKGKYGFFWACPACRTIYRDKLGKPQFPGS